MALINCQECGAQISDQAASCPKCGAPVAAKAPKKEESSGRLSVLKWVFMGIIGLVVFQCVQDSNRAATSSSAPKEMDSMDALFLCQTALKRASRDPEKAEVPYVPDMGKGKESYFAWGSSTKMARMRNGFGLEVATSASCTVDRPTKRITSLTLDGKSII